MPVQTLLVGLAHPDDELALAGSILAQRARGDRVVVVWLTRGERTEAFGPLPPEQVAARREEMGERAAEILGVEARFLDFGDTRLVATPEAAERVARVVAEIRPDALATWGEGWTRGLRHPDHQACGKIFRDAVTLARIAKAVAPEEPHRAPVPVFTIRDLHSVLPAVMVDVEAQLEGIDRLARFYHREIGFGDPEWNLQRLRMAGQPWGLEYAELFDAWESQPGRVETLLPASPAGLPPHPERAGTTAGQPPEQRNGGETASRLPAGAGPPALLSTRRGGTPDGK
jgi:LmbE family N-acetylglucosaminyl deacetylase